MLVTWNSESMYSLLTEIFFLNEQCFSEGLGENCPNEVVHRRLRGVMFFFLLKTYEQHAACQLYYPTRKLNTVHFLTQDFRYIVRVSVGGCFAII